MSENVKQRMWSRAERQGAEYLCLEMKRLNKDTIAILHTLNEQGLEPHLFESHVAHTEEFSSLSYGVPLYHIAVDRKFEDRMRNELAYKLSTEDKPVQDLSDARDVLPRAEKAQAQGPSGTMVDEPSGQAPQIVIQTPGGKPLDLTPAPEMSDDAFREAIAGKIGIMKDHVHLDNGDIILQEPADMPRGKAIMALLESQGLKATDAGTKGIRISTAETVSLSDTSDPKDKKIIGEPIGRQEILNRMGKAFGERPLAEIRAAIQNAQREAQQDRQNTVGGDAGTQPQQQQQPQSNAGWVGKTGGDRSGRVR